MRRFGVVFAALLAGCATATVPTGPPLPERADSNQATRVAPCVPPGFRPVADWHLESQQADVTQDAAGGSVMMIFRVVSRSRISTDIPAVSVWIGQLLAWIDPAPSDFGVPVWYDAGVMTPTGEGDDAHLVPNAERRRACDWKEFMVPHGVAHEDGYQLPPVTPGEDRRI